MCLRLVASLAVLAVAQQEPRRARPSRMNLEALEDYPDEAAMLRLGWRTQTRATRPTTHSSWTSRRSSGTAMFSIIARARRSPARRERFRGRPHKAPVDGVSQR